MSFSNLNNLAEAAASKDVDQPGVAPGVAPSINMSQSPRSASFANRRYRYSPLGNRSGVRSNGLFGRDQSLSQVIAAIALVVVGMFSGSSRHSSASQQFNASGKDIAKIGRASCRERVCQYV